MPRDAALEPRSRGLASEAREAFGTGTQLDVRVLSLPIVFPLTETRDHRAFWKKGWPAAVVTSRRRAAETSFDAMADVVFGLAAVVARLCGGEGH